MNTILNEYKRLVFVLQDAWPIVHGCKDETLKQECSALLRADKVSETNNVRMREALQKIWPMVNTPLVSNSLQVRVYGALDRKVDPEPWAEVRRREDEARMRAIHQRQ